jgi:hypothetical protein
MKFANAVKTYRKFGVAEGRDLRCAIRVPRIYRGITTLVARKGPLLYRDIVKSNLDSSEVRQSLRGWFLSTSYSTWLSLLGMQQNFGRQRSIPCLNMDEEANQG